RAPNGAKYSHYLLNPGTKPVAVTSVQQQHQQHQQHQHQQHQWDRDQDHHHNQHHYHQRARSEWRPRQGVVVATLREHAAAVNRLALSQDQSFFVSASSDGTCKVWELRGMDHNVSPQARVSYTQQGGRVLDACMVDNSHSVASASSNGTIHVWRVELAGSASSLGVGTTGTSTGMGGGGGSASGGGTAGSISPPIRSNPSRGQHVAGTGFTNPPVVGVGGTPNGSSHGVPVGSTSGAGSGGKGVAGGGALRVSGSTLVRCVGPGDGEVLSVHHFNTELGSPLVFGTRRGGVRAWDLRARE
ncbi:unnamed protein product, partial [Discosporangium mesarthrocarpum]